MKKTFSGILIIICICTLFFIGQDKPKVFATTETIEYNTLEYNTPEYNTPECYQQSKDLWSSYTIGGGSIANNGCGIVSLTNAVNYVTGNYIDPIEMANYAYSIDAYNGSIGGGTARWVLYNQLAEYEQKFGFKVVETGRTSSVRFPNFIKHLQNGGVSVAHVYGHFIAIVGYNAENKTYLVYDCAASPTKRQSYPYGTWMTEEQLTTLQYMKVDWFCMISKTVDGIVSLDQDGHIYQNSKASVSYSVTETENKAIPVSGFALDTRGIASFCYVIDSGKTEYPLTSVYKEGILEQFSEYSKICSASQIGFEGYIDTTSLSIGEHRIIIRAKTTDNGVRDVAEVMINKSNKEASIDKTKRTYTIDMSRYMGQKDIIKDWSQAGITDYCFRANYGTVIDLGKLDLSIYKKAEIIYSTDQNFDADKNGVQSIIGFKSANLDFGYYGKKVDLTNNIAYANMVDAKGGWTTTSVATIDLSNINYFGSVYLNGYNQEGALYVVHQVVFYYNDEYIFHNFQQATCTDPLICMDCGKREGIPLGHNWQEATCQHAKTCARCGTIEGEITDHKWEEANCTTPRKCVYCELTEGGPIGHQYETSNVDPTCDEQGYIEHKCNRCQDIYKTDFIASLGHIYVHHKGLEPTCMTNGYQPYDTCERCDYTTYEEIRMLTHSYTVTTIEPTCEEQGYDLKQCIRCEYHFKTKKVKPLGHNFIHCDKVEATCTTEGHSEGEKCTRCGQLNAEVIEALHHQYVSTIIEPTKNEQGYTKHICVNCGDQYIDNYTNTLKKNCKKSSVMVIAINFSFAISMLYIFKKKKCYFI